MSEILNTLEENTPDVYIEVTDIILRTIDNVLNYPQNPRFRKLRLGNDIVSNKLIPSIGAMECLFHMGFEEADDALILPETVPLERLRIFKEAIIERRIKFQNRYFRTFTSIAEKDKRSTRLLDQIRAMSKTVLCYEDKKLQALAREKMPLDELKKRRDHRLKNTNSSYEREFGLLFELIIWFKTEFFQWMNHPICEKCKSSSTFKGYSDIPSELVQTRTVEVYTCEKCQARLLFPRYNNPATLLETRIGRCGEWANCFTLFCRTIDLDARYILDKTDHVWTEVYSDVLKRWIHCDPCEGVVDTPLMYEKGWNKKLSYVIAFSKDEVQDVTWRYTTDFPEVRGRRILCDEYRLLQLLMSLSEDLQKSFPIDRKKYLAERRVRECVELLTPPHTDKQFSGRTSGSLAWRLSRGETREGKLISTIWKPNDIELQRKQFRLKYCAATNKYYRVETNEVIDEWENGVFEVNSIIRKVEYDWRKCYLSRSEGSNQGIIKWKFTTEGTDYVIDMVKISYSSEEFHNGHIRWILCDENICIPLRVAKKYYESRGFCGSSDLTLTATLSGGFGMNAWQHAQIFRQSIDSEECPFELNITLKPRK